jgi:hypothetical protein
VKRSETHTEAGSESQCLTTIHRRAQVAMKPAKVVVIVAMVVSAHGSSDRV